MPIPPAPSCPSTTNRPTLDPCRISELSSSLTAASIARETPSLAQTHGDDEHDKQKHDHAEHERRRDRLIFVLADLEFVVGAGGEIVAPHRVSVRSFRRLGDQSEQYVAPDRHRRFFV